MKAWEELYSWVKCAREWNSRYAEYLQYCAPDEQEILRQWALRAHVADRQWRGI